MKRRRSREEGESDEWRSGGRSSVQRVCGSAVTDVTLKQPSSVSTSTKTPHCGLLHPPGSLHTEHSTSS